MATLPIVFHEKLGLKQYSKYYYCCVQHCLPIVFHEKLGLKQKIPHKMLKQLTASNCIPRKTRIETLS